MLKLEQPSTGPGAAAAPAADWTPTIIALICNWCTYAGADMAGTTRREYPATVRSVRVPCTGRIDPLLIMKAFQQGADGVLVSGCHPGDCHYIQGNYFARRRFAIFRSLMDFLGLDQQRLHFAWVSASEGAKWQQVVEEVTASVREVGPIGPFGAVPETGAPVELPTVPSPPRARPAPDEQQRVAGHLRQVAAMLLEQQRAAVVVGYRPGPLPDTMVPAFITRPEDAVNLGWDERCYTNLITYVPAARRRWGKVAVVVKACDATAASGLLRESQIPRDDLTLVGVSCPGAWQEDALALKCYACAGEVPPVCDYSVIPGGVQEGAVASGTARAVAPDPRDALVAHLASQPAADRSAYWTEAFEQCLRCYACRAACPLCYCQVCVTDKNQPQWVPTSIDGPGNFAWNLTRAFHLAGRCTGCDECTRVCPADIRLDLINHRLAQEVEHRFGAFDLADPESAPPLAAYRPDDPQEFIR